ncbi:hypothetical protein BX600DRAFT_508323 [Xylariales sp. PMI_506]|nr:hypothetical protein BX600DRAFT_508323 [Xylariales sp. PMI_506]
MGIKEPIKAKSSSEFSSQRSTNQTQKKVGGSGNTCGSLTAVSTSCEIDNQTQSRDQFTVKNAAENSNGTVSTSQPADTTAVAASHNDHGRRKIGHVHVGAKEDQYQTEKTKSGLLQPAGQDLDWNSEDKFGDDPYGFRNLDKKHSHWPRNGW